MFLYTYIYSTSTCLAKIENMKEFTFMQSLISIISNSSLKLIIVLMMPPATLVQGQINSAGDSGVSSDLHLSD